MSDDQLRALVALGSRVQEHYGQPQDTEWAIDRDGALWLTQARPVTTLFPLPDVGATDDELRVYFCFSLAQGLTRPLTPMGISAIRVIASSVARLYGHPPVDPLGGPPRSTTRPGGSSTSRRSCAAIRARRCSPGCST